MSGHVDFTLLGGMHTTNWGLSQPHIHEVRGQGGLHLPPCTLGRQAAMHTQHALFRRTLGCVETPGHPQCAL
jgi:hypothetical protein